VAHDFNNLLTAVIGCLDLIAYQIDSLPLSGMGAVGEQCD